MQDSFAKQILQKTAEDYEKIAEEFSETRFLLWPEFDEFKTYIKENDKVLDLGCGNGRLYELFKDLSTRYIGIDKSEILIKRAREKWKNYSAKFLVGDILDSSNKEKFDAVFLIAVLHHIPSRKLRLKVLRNVYSVLKPGGYFFMTNWKFWQKKYFPYIIKYTILKLVPAKAGVQNKMDFGDILVPWKAGAIKTYGKINGKLDRYYHVFTKREIASLVKKAGFSIIKNKKSKWNYVTVCRKGTKPPQI